MLRDHCEEPIVHAFMNRELPPGNSAAGGPLDGGR
jgi:hypothetical protein